VWHSVQDDFLCLRDIIGVTGAASVFLASVQIDAQLVAETEILVPREGDGEDLPDEGRVSSQEGEGGVKSVGYVLFIANLITLAQS